MDPLRDDRFPDRPQHPDFWKMSEIVLQHDGRIEESEDKGDALLSLLSSIVDIPSLFYMAEQRVAMLMLRLQDEGLPLDPNAILTAIYTDAFMLGHKFCERGGKQDA